MRECKCGDTNQSYKVTKLLTFTGRSPSMRPDRYSLWTSRRSFTPSFTCFSHKDNPISKMQDSACPPKTLIDLAAIKVLVKLYMRGKRLMPPHLHSWNRLYNKITTNTTCSVFTIKEAQLLGTQSAKAINLT